MKSFGAILAWSVIGLCVGFIAIQFVPVNRTNPSVGADLVAPTEVVSILRRACYDCHSNETAWPWYSRIAPVSWLIAHDVNEGRAALNFSTWNRLNTEKQADAMHESWEEVAEGKMPTWYYVAVHPEARLSAADKSALRAWALSVQSNEAGKDHDD
jgi:heme-binding protein